jgi:hypothetical protein
MYMNKLLKKFGALAGPSAEPRTMQLDGTKAADAKLRLAS